MIKGQESRQMSSLLALGFLADRALIQLGMTGNSHEDRTVWKPLGEFLQAAVRQVSSPSGLGRPVPHGQGFSRPAAELDWQLIASQENVPQEAAFVEWLESLRETVAALGDAEQVEQGRTVLLKDFLERIARISLAQAQSLRESTESGRHREQWPLTARI